MPHFVCHPPKPLDGPVLFYSHSLVGHYLYMDANEVVVEVESLVID